MYVMLHNLLLFFAPIFYLFLPKDAVSTYMLDRTPFYRYVDM